MPELSWPPKSREELAAAVRERGYYGAAKLYGVTRNTVRDLARRWGIVSPYPGGRPAGLRQRGDATAVQLEAATLGVGAQGGNSVPGRLLELLRQPRSLAELADALDRGPGTVLAWLKELEAKGYLLLRQDDRWVLGRQPTAAEAETCLPAPQDGRIRIGIVADTHLGSKFQQLTYLQETYRRFEDAGVQEVYHVGDLLDGVDVYAGQHPQQFLHTYDEQVDYAVEHYPRTSLRTKVIGGNHDLAAVRRGAPDPLRLIAQRRPDMEYLGPYSAWPTLGRLLMYLLHPQGSPAYAISYKLQKIVESFEGGRKPHVLAVGHWHQMAYIHVRNVHAFYPGCFQAQTEFERRKGLQPQIGALLLDIRVADDGSWQEITPTFHRYFAAKEKDY